jgi:hypothetical protein
VSFCGMRKSLSWADLTFVGFRTVKKTVANSERGFFVFGEALAKESRRGGMTEPTKPKKTACSSRLTE